MTKVEALEREVANLSAEELAAFRKWFRGYVSANMTDAIDKACDATGDDHDHLVTAAAARTLSTNEW